MELDSVYVRYINLDRRIDRNEDVLKKFTEILGFKENNIKRFSAIDGTNIVNDLKKKNYLDDELITTIKNLKINVKSPELGCLLSHYLLLKEIFEDNSLDEESLVFIFEDDFFINTEYLEKINFTIIINEIKTSSINKNNNWDIIYLGGRFKKNFVPLNKNFFVNIENNLYLRINGHGMDWDRTTHCYLIKKKNIPNIINCYLEYFKTNLNPAFQVDSFYNLQSNKIKMYDYFPHIFYSPWYYSTDIQLSKIIINTKDIIDVKGVFDTKDINDNNNK
jgi:GR25 family glycosyltransferase involved in LPS biosynthesis